MKKQRVVLIAFTFIFLFIGTLHVKAQDTTLVSNCLDLVQFNGQTVELKNTLVIKKPAEKYGIGLFAKLKEADQLEFIFKVIGGGKCIEEGALITFSFTNGQSISFTNELKFNCDQRATVSLTPAINATQINFLRYLWVSNIYVKTRDSEVTMPLNFEQQTALKTAINCLYKAKADNNIEGIK